MKKILKGFKKSFKNRRGSILAITLFIVTLAGIAALIALFSMLAEISNVDGSSIGSYSAAEGCLGLSTTLLSGISTIDTNCGDVYGSLDLLNSTPDAVTCAESGSASSVLAIGSQCSCITQIAGNSSPYETQSVGKCNSSASGNRLEPENYTVAITKTIIGTAPCTPACPPDDSVAPGGVCSDGCGTACETACAFAPSPPPPRCLDGDSDGVFNCS